MPALLVQALLLTAVSCAAPEVMHEGTDDRQDNGTSAPISAADIDILEVFDVSALNEGLDPSAPTVDLNFYLTDEGRASWDRMQNAVEGARDIYAQAGVQVRVGSARAIHVPSEWQTLEPSVLDEPTVVEYRESDLYRHQDDVNRRLASRTEAIFDAVVSLYDEDEVGVPARNALHIVSLNTVPIAFYEWTGEEWLLKTAGTSGLSFPPYMFADRMPEHLRGIITMSGSGTKTLAHEMGHNLMNISHEGVGVCPAFATHGDDLMLYGSGTRIPAGLEGRWQQERLHLSPFLYYMADGERVFDNEFLDGGRYFDRLYGEFAIDPPCGTPESEDAPDEGPF